MDQHAMKLRSVGKAIPIHLLHLSRWPGIENDGAMPATSRDPLSAQAIRGSCLLPILHPSCTASGERGSADGKEFHPLRKANAVLEHIS